MTNSEKIQTLIEGILRRGSSAQVPVDGENEEDIQEVCELYTKKGYKVRREGDSLLVEAKGERKLLKG